jgi:hypothetical protein
MRFLKLYAAALSLVVVSLAIASLLLPGVAKAQSIVSGEITGTVTDPSGAVVPNVKVVLTSAATAQAMTTTTTSAGLFRFPLLTPGKYNISASPIGFAAINRSVEVALGRITNVALTANVVGKTETVVVEAAGTLMQTEDANVTANFSQAQIALLPAPGNDMTNFALTAPGVAVSTGAGYGNFSAFGLPGTSNLYTVNGSDDNDPFNGLNNSGASNNTLGTNELAEMTIVTNGYSGQYGRSAGANINYATKSGANQFHGDAIWQWNGRYLNANDWFANNQGSDRPFANSNMWAGAVGGPIVKNKIFFFYDNEGMRYVLPSTGFQFVPSSYFQAQTLANIPANEQPFYNKMFNLYNAANGGKFTTETDANNPYGPGEGLGCGDMTGNPIGTGVWGDDAHPCAAYFVGGGSNKNIERLMSFKIDVIPTDKDKLSFRYWQDRGLQATYTDAISSVFNAQSNQPQDQGQLTWTRTLNNRMVNQFILDGSYYSAIFSAIDLAAARAAFPTTYMTLDGDYSDLGGEDYAWPQGRRVGQYGLVDDFSWSKGDHNLKFGVNLRHDAITDLTPFRNTTGELELSMTSLYTGLTGADLPNYKDVLVQRYEAATEVGFKIYSLGLYAQDEWRANSKLRMTFSVRVDRNSNESSSKGQLARFAGAFAPSDASVPYNQSLLSGLTNAFASVEPAVFAPRVGFAWSPRADKTVVRGGVGLFSDLYPGQLAEPFASNPPYAIQFSIGPGGGLAGGNPVAYDSSVPNNLEGVGQASYNAFTAGFSSGQTLSQMQAAGLLALPTVTAAPNNFKNPKYWQWNLEIEQAFGAKTSLDVNYVGNHGYNEVLRNATVNSYTTTYAFAGLPSSAPDPRFGVVTQYSNAGYSNYDGLVVSLHRSAKWGFQGNLNYSYSHSLDTVSNAGLEPFNNSSAGSSITLQIYPDLHSNYANSDYDFRHDLSANYVWQSPFKPSNMAMRQLAGGWVVSGTFFGRDGEPFSAYHSSTTYMNNASGNVVLSQLKAGQSKASCDGGNAICLARSQFTQPNSTTTVNVFGTSSRNSFRGPKYFDTDMNISKKVSLREKMAFSFGADFYNILNHPNFANPSGNTGSGSFGQVLSTATPPSSPYGNFQGAAVSGRIVQSVMKFEF